MSRPSPHRRLRTAVPFLALLVGLIVVPASGNAAPPGPDCGPRLKKAQGGVWQCTFADSFDGTRLDSASWGPLLTARTGVNTRECRLDRPDTISVSGGTLRLSVVDLGKEILCESPAGDYWTRYAGGGVHTSGNVSPTYGRIEIRAKFPKVDVVGLHSALWMWPEEQRYGKDSGEIDIAEWRSGLSGRVVPTVHYNDDGTDTKKTNWHCYVDNTWDFHTYTVEWTQDTLTFLYDGKVCLVNEWSPAAPLEKPQPFDEPFFLIMNQALGIGQNAFDPAVTPLPATMEVDHVRVWK
jgi:beta-glucanase (GH16 family)